MRLGLLGPALDQGEALASAARGLRERLGADRVVYLGADSALDDLVRAWAEELVGPRADDATLMSRATRACLDAAPDEIEAFLDRERQRTALRMFESLAGESTRSVELIGGKVAVLLYDKAELVEDDILPATLLVFGKSKQSLIKQVGRRWFLSPGTFPAHGILVVEDTGGELRATSYDPSFELRETVRLEAPQALKMRALGAS